MGWNPFDQNWKQQIAMQVAMADENSAPKRRRRREIFVAAGIPIVLIVGVAFLLNFRDFSEFWKGQAALASGLRVFAAVCAAVSLLLLIRLAFRRYRPEPDSFAPAWFVLALAGCELLRAAAVLLFLLSMVGFNFTFNGAQLFFAFPVAVIAPWIAEEVLRWRGEPYGWTAGRLFDPRVS